MFGSSGTSGVNGSTGADGSSGSSGTSFYGVTSGTSGLTGTSGTNAPGYTSGTSGTNGSYGAPGTNGTNGSAGTSGFLNLTGTTNNGIITYDSVLAGGQVESGVTYDGTTLTITGNTTQTGDVGVTGAISSTTYKETYSDLGTGGSVTLDLATANNFRRQFNGTSTITFSNVPSGKAFGFTLVVVNAGAYSITWPSVKWSGGSAPILTSAGTDVIVIYTYDGGTTYYGFVTGKNLS
jgi:hypothetical protein